MWPSSGAGRRFPGDRDLQTNKSSDLAPDRIEFVRSRIARARKIDPKIRLESAGTPGHDQQPIGEEDRFVDTMGNEQHGAPGLLPDAHQLFAEERARLSVEGG